MIIDFVKRRVVNDSIPNEELIDPLNEGNLNSITNPTNCIITTHTVNSPDELTAFMAGYISGANEKLPNFQSNNGPLDEDDFREYMAGFYVSMMERNA